MKTVRWLALMIAVLMLDAATGTIVAAPAAGDAATPRRDAPNARRHADGPQAPGLSSGRGTARV